VLRLEISTMPGSDELARLVRHVKVLPPAPTVVGPDNFSRQKAIVCPARRSFWLVETLGLELPDPARYSWAQVTPADPDYLPPEQRLLHVVADRARWRAALIEARRRDGSPTGEPSATGRAA
jgi:hypothetical protein